MLSSPVARIMLAFGCLAAALSVGTASHAVAAPPPTDCNTPNGSGGTGILEQSPTGNLTKALSNTIHGSGSTTYFFTLTTTRPTTNDSGSGSTVSYTASTLTDTSKSWATNQWTNAFVVAGTVQATVASNTSNTLTLTAPWSTQPANGTAYTVSFFKELTDCAWDVTQGGSAATANYASQQNSATFTSGGQLGISLTVNANDAICDRVELKGNTSTGTPFADYSNLLGSPNGTNCTLPASTPEVPSAALIGLIGTGGAVAAILWTRRRRHDGGASAPAAS